MLKRSRTYLAFLLGVIIALAPAHAPQASGLRRDARDYFGELSASGRVWVDGLPALTGLTLFTASRIETGEASSAVVGFGRLGRLELLPESEVRLDFAETSIAAALAGGGLRCAVPRGITAEVTTPDGYVRSDPSAPSLFIVRIERGRTSVETHAGRATLQLDERAVEVGSGRQYAPATAAAGASPAAPARDEEENKGKRAGVIIAAAAAIGLVGTVIYLALTEGESEDEEFCFCCGIVCVSPSR